MSTPATIRERIRAASDFFYTQHGVLLTTFNLDTRFLEGHALPAVFNIDAETDAAQRSVLHQKLWQIPCTVFYDPSTDPRLSGKFRYVARPVPIPGLFFHPKLVIIAGQARDATTWVYLAVSSANLTMSGWGRNVECFGETWIYQKAQQSWTELRGFLDWTQQRIPLFGDKDSSDATGIIKDTLDRMPENRRPRATGDEPWLGKTDAQFYASVLHPDGFPGFLQQGRSRRASELWVYSPYWGDLAANISRFGTRRTVLIPALRYDRSALSISREQVSALDELPAQMEREFRRNDKDEGERFWHMKTYSIFHGDRGYTAVGSCNFTTAGLAGSSGNVEAMLVFEEMPDWLPEGVVADVEDYADQASPEEDAPEPAPIAIVVAYDWRDRCWHWWLEATPNQRDCVLKIPGLQAFPIENGTGEHHGPAPDCGCTFIVKYRNHDGEKEWKGYVVELHLDLSTRTYGRDLAVHEILESWIGVTPTLDLDGGRGAIDLEEDHANEPDQIVQTAFDVLNLYNYYRATQAMKVKLAGYTAQPELQRALLARRPDSVLACVHKVMSETRGANGNRALRFLVLRELHAVLSDWSSLVDGEMMNRVTQELDSLRTSVVSELALESNIGEGRAQEVLEWYEKNLTEHDENP